MDLFSLDDLVLIWTLVSMVRPEDQIEFLNVSDNETDSDHADDEDPDSNGSSTSCSTLSLIGRYRHR